MIDCILPEHMVHIVVVSFCVGGVVGMNLATVFLKKQIDKEDV